MNKDMIKSYVKSINKIDDFFEYKNESLKDREFVHKVLEELTQELYKLRDHKTNEE